MIEQKEWVRTPDAEDLRLWPLVEQLVGRKKETFSADDWADLCETTRLSLLYPDEWVVFLDHWEYEGEFVRLRWREVKLHTTDESEAWAAHNRLVASLPSSRYADVGILYMDTSGPNL